MRNYGFRNSCFKPEAQDFISRASFRQVMLRNPMTNVFPWHRYTWRSMARTALIINHSEIAVSELRTNRRGHCVMAACRRGNIHATVGTVRVLRTEGFSCPKANSAQQFSESRVGAQVVKS